MLMDGSIADAMHPSMSNHTRLDLNVLYMICMTHLLC